MTEAREGPVRGDHLKVTMPMGEAITLEMGDMIGGAWRRAGTWIGEERSRLWPNYRMLVQHYCPNAAEFATRASPATIYVGLDLRRIDL